MPCTITYREVYDLIVYNAYNYSFNYKSIYRKVKQQYDENLMNRFQQGDVRAFNYFFDKNYATVCYFAYSLLQNQPAAEEIADDAFVKLWKRHHLYDSHEAIKAFLYRTVRNAAIDVIRRNKTQTSLQKELQSRIETTAPYILQHIIRAETLALIYAAFDILPPKCREVFTLLYIEGKTYEEAAEALKLSINNVRNHKMRALTLLRGQLGNLLVLLLAAGFLYV